MYVKYEESDLMSRHFPFKKHHNTVLRMDNEQQAWEQAFGFQNGCIKDCLEYVVETKYAMSTFENDW